jgi:hypothetical protein
MTQLSGRLPQGNEENHEIRLAKQDPGLFAKFVPTEQKYKS